MSFENCWIIRSSDDFRAHQQHSQRRCCCSQTAVKGFRVLPGLSPGLQVAPRLVVGAHRLVIGTPRLVVSTPRVLIGAPRHVVGAPRLVAGGSRCSQACRRRSQVLLWLSPDILCPPRFFAGPPRCTWMQLHQSRTLWDLTTAGFGSDNFQTLP